MKYAFSIIFSFLVFGNLSFAQDKYFHELRGMEDSTGTTHLFYRVHTSDIFTCNDEGIEFNIYPSSDDIYHVNTETLTDSVKFQDYYSPWCLSGFYNERHIGSYTFLGNNPDKWIFTEGFECGYIFSDFKNNSIPFPTLPCLIKSRKQVHPLSDAEVGFFNHPISDSVFIHYYSYSENSGFKGYRTLGYSVSGDSLQNPGIPVDYSGFGTTDFADSISIPHKIVAFHPTIDSISFAMDEDYQLSVSSDYYRYFERLDSTYLYSIPVFDADSSVVYAFKSQVSGQVISSRMIVSYEFGKPGTWSELTDPDGAKTLKEIIPDPTIKGRVYVYDHNSVFISDDYGTTFRLLFESENEFKTEDVYIKPGGEIMYYLTDNNLYEVNLKTGSETIIKSLPVSSESEPEQPNQFTLHQNYPNPFNPSTVISYELSVNSHVRLKVYDLLGREVAELVNTLQAAGTHEVTFDASSLSSGVYLYTLQTGEVSLTRKFTLIK